MSGDWRERLLTEVKRQGRTLREVSLAAGLNETYLSDNLRRNKKPGMDSILKVCGALNVSFNYILTGAVLPSDIERAAINMASVSDSRREEFVSQSQEGEPFQRTQHAPGRGSRKPSGLTRPSQKGSRR